MDSRRALLADQKPDGNEGIISDGNTFVLRFLITLALITYFIVPRPSESQLKVNANVGEGERLIDQHRVDILDAIRQNNRARDRKSTRLNSSHLGISYAVFCLKKTKL